MSLFKINVHFQRFYIINKCYFTVYDSYLVSIGGKMINFSEIFLLNELSRLKKENEKLFNKNIELRNELKDTRCSRFKLASKLEALNNYIAFLEVKLRG